MKKWLFVSLTLLIMLCLSTALIFIIDGMVQIDDDYAVLVIFLTAVNLVIGYTGYRIYRRIKPDHT